jgi:hypothetical protein
MRAQPFRASNVLDDVFDDLCAVYWTRGQLPDTAGRRNLEAGADEWPGTATRRSGPAYQRGVIGW